MVQSHGLKRWGQGSDPISLTLHELHNLRFLIPLYSPNQKDSIAVDSRKLFSLCFRDIVTGKKHHLQPLRSLDQEFRSSSIQQFQLGDPQEVTVSGDP